MRRVAVAIAVPALVLSVLMGGAAPASATSGGPSVSKVLNPPRCC